MFAHKPSRNNHSALSENEPRKPVMINLSAKESAKLWPLSVTLYKNKLEAAAHHNYFSDRYPLGISWKDEDQNESHNRDSTAETGTYHQGKVRACLADGLL